MLILDDKDKFAIESTTTDDIKNKSIKRKRKDEIKHRQNEIKESTT